MSELQLELQHKTLMQVMGKLYAKHTRLGLDEHEPTTDKMCSVCDEILAKTKEIQKIERQLKLKTKKNIQKKVTSNKTEPHQTNYTGPAVYQVTINEKQIYLLRAQSEAHIIELLAAFNLKPSKIEKLPLLDYQTTKVELPNHSIKPLTKILNEQKDLFGVIAEKGISTKAYLTPQFVQFKKARKLIRYNGQNVIAIEQFLAPNSVSKAKKKNKLNIVTPDGHISLSVDEYLLEIIDNRYIKLTESELKTNFDVEVNQSWLRK